MKRFFSILILSIFILAFGTIGIGYDFTVPREVKGSPVDNVVASEEPLPAEPAPTEPTPADPEKIYESIKVGDLLLNYIPFVRDYKMYSRVAANIIVLILSISLGAVIVKTKKVREPKGPSAPRAKKQKGVKLVEAGSTEIARKNKVNF